MPLIETKGAASAQGFGEFAQQTAATYIEDVFSTYLYTGTGSAQTITNGIDLSTKGGMVWIKGRSGATDHALYDTARGATKDLVSNSTAAETTQSTGLTAFNGTGFSIGALAKLNTNAATYASWTFREQPKFFDVVTYTGDGANRTISHNLGSVPGCIIVKRTDAAADWQVYHRSLANTQYLVLNDTAAAATGTTRWNSTTPTSTVFSLGTDTTVNASGGAYVAYIFAHNAGGFGLTGTDNVISCGSYSGGSQFTNLGWEPQFVMIKRTDAATGWLMFDSMRALEANEISTIGNTEYLQAHSSAAEINETGLTRVIVAPRATGFYASNDGSVSGGNYIYIAIRRGPMKVPTSGTSVFAPVTFTGPDAPAASNFPVDFSLYREVNVAMDMWALDRLRGATALFTDTTGAESGTGVLTTGFQSNTTFQASGDGNTRKRVYEMFRRAPGFADVVCYTGTGSNTTQTHNLGVVPELIIVKRRDTTGAWDTYSAALSNTEYLVVNTTAAKATGATRWNSTTPTSTVFSLGTSTTTNASGGTYVAYLFATCAGVSKVGTYTGTGALQTINCGFTGGARFVLIKRTDSTGDWYVYDSARGIVAGSDPYLTLNTNAAEVTTTDWVDTYSAGFELSNAGGNNVNINGATYIFLSVA